MTATTCTTLCGVALLCALALGAAPAGANIYRCVDPQGVVNFADRPCPRSVSRQLYLEHSIVESVPLDIDERRRLQAINRRLATMQDRARVDALRKRNEQRAKQRAAVARCDAARRAQGELRDRKRRGYPLRHARRIAAEERTLRSDIDAYCGA
ncbi:MAG: DUF4124 domain-containing protein [Pseudomonadota bacterium]